MKKLIDKLEKKGILTKKEFIELVNNYNNDELYNYAISKASEIRKKYYGNKVYIRGLIEISNYCKNNCLYCGIRIGNRNIERYRLTKEEILECCETGHKIGFRTFVLQGGEDLYYSDNDIVEIVSTIKEKYPDCAVTLSIGEKEYDTYKKYKDAGADRYLLRHETANKEHYGKIHPNVMNFENRMRCLHDLKALGYQAGTGFMVGSPFQTPETIAEDLLFINKFQPAMVGIGPFIPHHETPFKEKKMGSTKLTLFLIAILRIMLPKVLLPSTTALGTADNNGRSLGILAGANVIMPNLSPVSVRKKYMIYDNKKVNGCEASENLEELRQQMNEIGYEVVVDRGDALDFT